MILTDAVGKPIEAPRSLSPNATLDEKIAHIEARYAFRDRVTDLCNQAFAQSFRDGLRLDSKRQPCADGLRLGKRTKGRTAAGR